MSKAQPNERELTPMPKDTRGFNKMVESLNDVLNLEDLKIATKLNSWTIEFVTQNKMIDIVSNQIEGDHSCVLGFTSFIGQRIFIDKSLRSSNMEKTIAHELVHALEFEYNIGDWDESELLAATIANYREEISEIYKTAHRITAIRTGNNAKI